MRKINILFLDRGLSRSKTAHALSSELNCTIFNLAESLREQLKNSDDLIKEMKKLLESGKMLTAEVLGKFIARNFNEIDGNILLPEYPRTVEQYNGLIKMLGQNNIELENIWYFKQRKPDQFMKDHFKNPKEKQWIDKYGADIIDKWKSEFKKRRKQIIELQNASDATKWKIIEVDYVVDVSSEFIKQQIKDCS